MVKAKLFSTTGIRGISNKDMNPEFALKLARTFATLIEEGTILVGRDTRTSSEMLKNAVVAGILSSGLNVVDTGIVPIPVVNFAVKENFDAGVMITSSHNPPEYNGMKFILKNGMEIAKEGEQKFEQIFNSEKFSEISWEKIGTYEQRDMIPAYIERALSLLDSEKIRQRKLKVVVDCGDGAQSSLISKMLKKLGCKVIILHCRQDGFFNRIPEPRLDTLDKLVETVKKEKADFGVGFDVDGDRAIFVTEMGEVLMGDVTASILAGEVLKHNKGEKVITTVASSSLIEDIVKMYNGTVLRTVIGAKEVGNLLLKENAIYGFEENGGCIFPELSPARDGAFAVAKIAELISIEQKSLAELRESLPKYYQFKGRVSCPDKRKEYVLTKLSKEITGKVDRTDGLKVMFKDGWVLLRPSGTEPIFRIFTEAKTSERAKELLEWGTTQVQKLV